MAAMRLAFETQQAHRSGASERDGHFQIVPRNIHCHVLVEERLHRSDPTRPCSVAAPHVAAVTPEAPGFVAAMDAREIGVAVVELGGGRTRHDAAIDHRVGLSEVAGIGASVGRDQPICAVHAADPSAAERAAARIRAAVRVSDTAPAGSAVVRGRIAAG